jgi:hypothetical protein
MAMERVCSSCFEDPDLRAWIRSFSGARGCDACGRYDSPTHELSEICEYIEECLSKFWGLAGEQLPYESAEGGYQGATWDTHDLVFDELQLSLPRDAGGQLFEAISRRLTMDVWCDWDWLSLDRDVALQTSWERFCAIVKHERRFFFQNLGGRQDDRDSYSAEALLVAIARLSQDMGLVRALPSGTRLWRARADIPLGKRIKPTDFGPPPAEFALQSNRMNPPGIVMMYTAGAAETAKRETKPKATTVRIGLWQSLRDARILDLRHMPEVPGIFSPASRDEILGMRFLRHFSDAIMTPVARDQRAHIDYLPSQVVTEFLRDFEFEGGPIEGIAYGSVVHSKGWNLALFVDASALCWGAATGHPPGNWLHFVRAVRR